MTSAKRPRTRLDVVLIDDIPALRVVFEQILSHTVDVSAEGFGDGPGAMAALQARAADGGPLDLVITDVKHPGANGIEIIHALRAHGIEGHYASGLRPSAVPVLVCSGFGCRESIDRTSGPVVLLQTPFRRHHLFAAVATLFRQLALTLECELACAPFVLDGPAEIELPSFIGARTEAVAQVARFKAIAAQLDEAAAEVDAQTHVATPVPAEPLRA